MLQEALRKEQNARTAGGQERRHADAGRPGAAPVAPPRAEVAGLSRPFKYNELIGKHGGLTALHFAARQGAADTVRALVEGGADVNQRTAGDRTTPMVIAAVNGHYDLVLYLLGKGGDPTLMTDAGMTPLYAVLNVEWAPKSFYPQPRAHQQQKASYLETMTALLDKGADPNARLGRKIGTRSTTSTCCGSRTAARRRSGAPPTPATSRR